MVTDAATVGARAGDSLNTSSSSRTTSAASPPLWSASTKREAEFPHETVGTTIRTSPSSGLRARQLDSLLTSPVALEHHPRPPWLLTPKEDDRVSSSASGQGPSSLRDGGAHLVSRQSLFPSDRSPFDPPSELTSPRNVPLPPSPANFLAQQLSGPSSVSQIASSPIPDSPSLGQYPTEAGQTSCPSQLQQQVSDRRRLALHADLDQGGHGELQHPDYSQQEPDVDPSQQVTEHAYAQGSAPSSQHGLYGALGFSRQQTAPFHHYQSHAPMPLFLQGDSTLYRSSSGTLSAEQTPTTASFSSGTSAFQSPVSATPPTGFLPPMLEPPSPSLEGPGSEQQQQQLQFQLQQGGRYPFQQRAFGSYPESARHTVARRISSAPSHRSQPGSLQREQLRSPNWPHSRFGALGGYGDRGDRLPPPGYQRPSLLAGAIQESSIPSASSSTVGSQSAFQRHEGVDGRFRSASSSSGPGGQVAPARARALTLATTGSDQGAIPAPTESRHHPAWGDVADND